MPRYIRRPGSIRLAPRTSAVRVALRQNGQALVEFTFVVPIMLVLLVAVGDFARYFATGISVESAARNAAEVAAREYAALNSPSLTSGDYATIHQFAVDTVCKELQTQPNAAYSSGTCAGIPTLTCVHDGSDPSCTSIAPSGVVVPPQCASFSSSQLPTSAQAGGTEASKYVEVRVCYRFSTLLNVSNIGGIGLPWGDFYIERGRMFTVADY